MYIPRDIWDAVVVAVVGQSNNPDRMLDLARLSWVCRDAYHAARHQLFRTLTIVFHDKDTIPIYSAASPLHHPEHLCAHVSAQVEQVFRSSVFPRFQLAQFKLAVTSKAKRVSHRVRRTLGAFWYLAPFVVIDGKLHLASMLENEAARGEEDDSDGEQAAIQAACKQSIESLWGQPVDVVVQDGLVCVPYPMELVSRIVICDMDAALYLFNREYSMFLDDVPSLLSIPVHQVDSLAVYTIGNNPDISKVYTKLSARYSQVSECDYTILGLVTQVPTVLLHSQRLRNFTLYRSHALFDDLDISNFLSHAHNLCSISLLGEGRFSLDWTQKTHGPFHSVHLTRLTLDYASSAGTVTSAPSQLAPFRIPNLKSLLVSFHIAHMLFCVQYLDDLFPTPTPTSATAFPKLTDLTLVDIRVKHDPIQYNHLSGGRYDGIAPFPTLPLLHMPRLTRLIVPSEHRTCAFSQTLSYAQLIQMTAEATMLQVLRLPSVIELTGCPNPPESGQDHAHRPVWPSIEFLEVNWRIMDRVGECVKFPHAKWRVHR